MPPSASVVIDNYNYGRFLRQAIESVLAQDYEGELECVVSDDGSTDESRAVISSFGGRVRPLLNDNRGQATAFNRGFAAARGEVVLLLDSDDYWTRDKVRKVCAAFADPAVGAVQHRLQDVDAGGAVIPRSFPAWPDRYVLEDYLDRRIHFGATSGLAFRRGALERILPLPPDIFYYLDDLLLVKALMGSELANLPEVLGYHRVHGGNYCAQGLREPEKIERDLRMRAIFRREIDPLLAARGLARTPRHERLEALEVGRRRILLHMQRGERGAALREWLAMVRTHGATRYGAFKAATCLAALVSPRLYLGLYERYEAGLGAGLRSRAFPE